jgi:glucosamine--fructose-6-phosphate aminotransferase (isomerizing)
MCGIVGYAGSQSAKNILIQGLKSLEYRGYDSAGVALYDQSQKDFWIRRSVGRVAQLEESTQKEGELPQQGIAHTRWATHGVPSEINAHPHRVGRVVLVHNGIIENHAQLKKDLLAQNLKFVSQTDTEVFAQLLNLEIQNYSKSQNFDLLNTIEKTKIVLEAIREASRKTEGHYSVLFMVNGIENIEFALHRGAPLVTGLSSKGFHIASDLQALLPYTQQLHFMSPHQLLVASPEQLKFYNIESLAEISVPLENIQWTADKVEKEGFEHFMLKEIHQQPMTVADTLSGRLPLANHETFIWDHPKAHEALWKNVKRLYLVACGTAYHAALVGKYYFENYARIPVEVDLASEFRYRSPILEAGTVVGVISQSGETADTLAALRLANEMGVSTFSICNVPGSTIMRESQFQYSTKAGPEIGVASTKAFTGQLTLLCALALDVAKLRGNKDPLVEEAVDSLSRLPHDLEITLQQDETFRKIGASLANKRTILFIGRGTMYPIALEGALKLKEITYRHAEGYAAGELKHGPIAMVDENLVAIVLGPTEKLLQKTLSNLEEIRSRRGIIIGVGESDNEDFIELCDEYIKVPRCSWATAPIIYNIPLQLISYGLAQHLGLDIDKPRNLAKSVTVE